MHVLDTRIEGRKGRLHFDIMTTDQETALTLAKHYLAGIGEADVPVTIKECQFRHSEPLVISSEQQRQFHEQGGFITALLPG